MKTPSQSGVGTCLLSIRSTSGVAFNDPLLVKDCQYPRDPTQPASKKKKATSIPWTLDYATLA